jgi:hypothetical protein
MRSVLALIVCSGCVNPTPVVNLAGTYRVDRDVGSAPCGMNAPDPNAPAFVIFRKMDLEGGSPYFTFDGCADPEGTNCPIMGSVFMAFAEPIRGGWRGRLSTATPGGGTCVLVLLDETAVLHGNQLVIETHTYRDQVQLSDADCQPGEAESRGSQLPCIEQSEIDATKI